MIDLLCDDIIHLCACFVFKIGVGVGEVWWNGRVAGAVDRGAGVRNEPTREKKM